MSNSAAERGTVVHMLSLWVDLILFHVHAGVWFRVGMFTFVSSIWKQTTVKSQKGFVNGFLGQRGVE